MGYVIVLVIGVAVGWLIPSPQWFKDAVSKTKDTVGK